MMLLTVGGEEAPWLCTEFMALVMVLIILDINAAL